MRGHLHSLFDPLWQRSGMTRSDAYSWLAAVLGVSKDRAHIGMLNRESCILVINLLNGGVGDEQKVKEAASVSSKSEHAVQ